MDLSILWNPWAGVGAGGKQTRPLSGPQPAEGSEPQLPVTHPTCILVAVVELAVLPSVLGIFILKSKNVFPVPA